MTSASFLACLPEYLLLDSAVLRRPEPRDAVFLQTLASDHDMLETAWIGLPFQASRAQVNHYLDELAAGWQGTSHLSPSYFLVDQASGVIFGSVLLRERGVELIELAYGIAPAARGRGWAQAMVQRLIIWAHEAAITLELRIPPDNLISQHVAEQTGFTRLGQLPDDDWHFLLVPDRDLQKLVDEPSFIANKILSLAYDEDELHLLHPNHCSVQ